MHHHKRYNHKKPPFPHEFMLGKEVFWVSGVLGIIGYSTDHYSSS